MDDQSELLSSEASFLGCPRTNKEEEATKGTGKQLPGPWECWVTSILGRGGEAGRGRDMLTPVSIGANGEAAVFK